MSTSKASLCLSRLRLVFILRGGREARRTTRLYDEEFQQRSKCANIKGIGLMKRGVREKMIRT